MQSPNISRVVGRARFDRGAYVAGKYKVTPARIIWEVEKLTTVSIEEMRGESREYQVVYARHLCFYIGKKYKSETLEAFSARFNRTHALMIYGCRKVEGYMTYEQCVRDDIKTILTRLGVPPDEQLEKL